MYEKNVTHTVLSGMRASGISHLGNYLGAVKGMIELQNLDYRTLYMVADVHSITTPYDPKFLRTRAREVVLDYLACGLDPNKSILFVQSDIPEHFELAAYFASVVTVARLQHLPTFKEKVKQHPEHVNMALLNYPVLMASDILVYKADLVPVGLDQEPHMEVAREIADKMNEKYDTSFPRPKSLETSSRYVPSLLGDGKMSKSVENSYINLVDDLETIKARLAKIPTDSGVGSAVPLEGSVANLLEFVGIFLGEERKRHFEHEYVGAGIRYKDLKDELAKAIYLHLQPIQEKRLALSKGTYIDDVIKEGAKSARSIARETLAEVRKKMGFSA